LDSLSLFAVHGLDEPREDLQIRMLGPFDKELAHPFFFLSFFPPIDSCERVVVIESTFNLSRLGASTFFYTLIQSAATWLDHTMGLLFPTDFPRLQLTPSSIGFITFGGESEKSLSMGCGPCPPFKIG